MPGAANLIVEARAALLDAVAALSAHRESVILVGAQAVYLRQSDTAPIHHARRCAAADPAGCRAARPSPTCTQ